MIIAIQTIALLLFVGLLYYLLDKNVQVGLMLGYAGMLVALIVYNGFTFGWPQLGNISLLPREIANVLMVAFAALVYFLADITVVNAIRNRAVILDFKYLLSGKVIMGRFIVSCFIGGLEEIFFRYYTVEMLGTGLAAILLGSVGFGSVHGVFSRYDVFSKALLGLICGVAYVGLNSLIYPIIFHITYNNLVLRKRWA